MTGSSYNHIKIFAKMNTFDGNSPNADGWIHLSVNSDYRSFENIVWSSSPGMSISGVLFQSFFGGGDASWASTKDQNIFIKNAVTGNSLTACN